MSFTRGTHIWVTNQAVIPLTLQGKNNNNIDVKPVRSTSPTPTCWVKEWPGEDSLVSTLLAWHEAVSMPPKRNTHILYWINYFGSEYELNHKIAYCYAHWVKKVGYESFKSWHDSWPEEGEDNWSTITIAQGCSHFQLEFNKVRSLKPTTSGNSGLGIAKGPIPLKKKRKRT
ncbi:hypothetical protein DFH28DRAFT_934408 [Melampsora americana]|nr:hypothetical protein DFH28DRAFT_934408 [Melampsora americana]